MLTNHETRTAIFVLRDKNQGIRAIARALGISRTTVKKVLQSGTSDVPTIERAASADEHLDSIKMLYAICEGNLVRVHEELERKGIRLRYSTLTAYCRRHGIGAVTKKPVGELSFEPGEEMQHDTSPHTVCVADKMRPLQCASLIMCFSRRRFAQVYPKWNRFVAKAFMTEALRYFKGSARRCMLDNCSVIVVRGTGKHAVMAPEMEAFGKHFGFTFVAHELGHKDRSAYVERSFSYIENNFYPGRIFNSLEDLNQQMRAWCDTTDHRTIRAISARPIDLFVTESSHLLPLPRHVPDPYRIHQRTVDEAGYVHLDTNRYSTPLRFIDRELTLHETIDRVRLYDGPRFVCEHARATEGRFGRATLEEHKRERQQHRESKPEPVLRPREAAMRASSPVIATMMDALRKQFGGRASRPLERLHRMWVDYPPEPLNNALTRALAHGLYDLDRIDGLVIATLAGDFFRLSRRQDDDPMTDGANDGYEDAE